MTELLRGEALPPETALPLGEVESLVSDSLRLSHIRPEQERAARRKYQICWLAMTAAICAEFFVLYLLSGRPERFVLTSLEQGGSMAMALLGCGLSITLAMTEETLPAYYDENIIRGYNNGFFRIQLMGVRISNRNWKAIKRSGFWSMLVWSLVFPGGGLRPGGLCPCLWGKRALGGESFRHPCRRFCAHDAGCLVGRQKGENAGKLNHTKIPGFAGTCQRYGKTGEMFCMEWGGKAVPSWLDMSFGRCGNQLHMARISSG